MPETPPQNELENNSEQEEPELQDEPKYTPVKVNNFTDFTSEVKSPTERNLVD